MGKQRFRKGLAGGLAALMLLQAMPMGASAWSIRDWFGSRDEEEETAQVEVLESREAQPQLQDGTAVIPVGSDAAAVKEILCEALVVNADEVDAQSLEWEYYCTGKNGLLTNDAWGSVNGFTSKKNVVFVPTTFTHPALAANSDGKYQVRIAGTGTAVTLTKVAKQESEITLKDNCTVALPYSEDATVNYDKLRSDIWAEVVADTTPELTVDDVTIEYYATATSGAVGDVGKEWVDLDGETIDAIGFIPITYPAISEGEQRIRISWDGNNSYSGFQKETTVTIAEQADVIWEYNDNVTVGLVYNEDLSIDYDAMEEAIYNAVVESNDQGLDFDDVTIEYDAGTIGENYKPLNNSDWYSLKKFGAGTWTIRFSWDGTQAYQAGSFTATVTVEDLPTVDWEYNETATVGLAYTADLNIDYEAMEKAIYDSVVISNTYGLDFDDVTIEYNADPTGWTDSFKPLNWTGETDWFSFGVGTWTIRFSWDGTQNYQGGSFEVTVTVEERPTAPYTLNNPIGSVTITVDENLETDFDALRTDIFNAVVDDFNGLTVNDVTITYYATAVSGAVGELGHNWVTLEGGWVNALNYPAISAGEQQIRIYWPGNQTYAPTTIEANVTVNDREQIQFNLNEGPYEVGMKFTADQGYDYEATAQAIYNAVVASNSLDIPYDQMTVEYNTDPTGTFDLFKPLNETDATGLVKFGTGEWEIRISWPGNQQYRGNSVTVNVTTTDNRLESSVALKSGVSFTYNMDPSVMEQAIFDSVIDWENSTLPNKDTLSLDNFTIEYYGTAVLFDGGIDSGIQNWVPVEGKSYDLGGVNLGAYPQLGAGENQQIRVSFHGNADYRPSDSTEGAVTVNKATVKVSVHSDNIYADEALPEGFITTDPADVFDQYVIYAGITSNVTTALYLDLPDRYDDNAFLKILDPVVEVITGKSFTQMLNDGVTVGELRELLSTQELLDLLDKLNIDTGTFGQILEAVNKMPGILDSVRISFGAPSRAGLYTVAVVTDNQNYETGFGMGFLLVKMRLSGVNLTWNEEIQNGKLTAEEAKTFDFGATLSYNGDTSISQESVSYLYSGFTSKWRVYSSTTTPPTEPGRYVMTVVTLGGNYQAAPITRSFQITK